ncbi:response regulator transcription factor [Caproiciproducens sp. NJN-50]|uniref:response regulator transcription factor n=1 Tax=Acutalibacteraceae TaxID=3082771 RepID=UPI000FFE1E82|nr:MULTISPECIES: response regulator transcription factor [Acutalibacteraceae]QAT49467.1 response regulator transcription factor [Caproiciproducens sp. NJN-50]
MPCKILVVDDETDIVELLRDYFEINGYEVLTAYNGSEALKQVEKLPDLILLDINLPDIDGLQVCTKIRSFVSCPILFLTAKIEDADKVSGFGAGGDDYIVKPFSIDELGARVSAHLRREKRMRGASKKKFAGDLVIDYGSRAVYCRNEQVPFAKKEFDMIELFSLNSGQVFDKERIYERVWGWDSKGDSSVVAEHVRRIRAKLSAVSDKKYIETVWGIGYKWID